MIDSDAWGLTRGLKLTPGEGCLVYIQAPYIVHRFCACVASECQQIWLRENDCVSVATPRGVSYDWHDHPLGLLIAVPEVE